MSDSLDIKGNPDEFQAALVAVVLDHLDRSRRSLEIEAGRPTALPGWVRAESEPIPGFEPWTFRGGDH